MIGVIGGTGLYQMQGLEIEQSEEIETPFGHPSSVIQIGTFSGQKVAFLPRHGSGHGLLPSEINYRANIWALKAVGVEALISVSAVGSLDEKMAPGDLVVPDQYIDWTKGIRKPSFFGEGLVAHLSTARVVNADLAAAVEEAGKLLDIKVHNGGTYICVEGPRLGTRAESFFLRKMGGNLVGMTNVPEVFLAREAQISYCTVAVVTDYDCWKDEPEDFVSVDKVIERYQKSITGVQHVLKRVLLDSVRLDRARKARFSLQGAVLSKPELLSPEKRSLLEHLGK